MSTFRKIIWAADPLEDKKIRQQGIRILQDLTKRTGASVEPAYVLSDGLLSLQMTKSELVSQYKPASMESLKQLAKESMLAKISTPTVLVVAPSSRGTAAEALDRHARKKGADLIFVNSHGRGGVKRMLMGSFAETLVLRSQTPVLISGPKTKHVAKLDHILFPTDFSKKSKKTFEKVLGLATKLKAKVTLLHIVVRPIEPYMQSATLLASGATWAGSYVKSNYDLQKKTAALWVLEAQKTGLVIETIFDVDSPSVTASILQHAHKTKPGLIAMASQSGAVSAALLGSIGRAVAREATCPVWFLRLR